MGMSTTDWVLWFLLLPPPVQSLGPYHWLVKG
jgi:hypothetical protein